MMSEDDGCRICYDNGFTTLQARLAVDAMKGSGKEADLMKA